MDFSGQLSYDRHFEKQDEAARRKSQARELGRVAKKRLQKLRHKNQAAEQQNSQHEHHQVGAGEIEILKHMDIDDGRLLKPLPDHQGEQARARHNNQRSDEVRAEPVLFLPLVQKNLERTNSHHQESNTDVVQFDAGCFEAL